MPVLRAKADDTSETIRVSIPKELAAELDAVKADAKKLGHEFPLSEIVAKALRRALKQARAELSQASGGTSQAARTAEPVT